MPAVPAYSIQQLSPDDVASLDALRSLFGEAFEDAQTYGAKPPGSTYLRQLLAGDFFLAVVARHDAQVIGGLAAYVLKKFEQERSEIYIYDLAVAAAHRRKGVATGLIRELERIAFERGAHVIFVQADPPDLPAVGLYSKLGLRQDVLHFDIAVRPA
jgi:aminoglycoside 3-N-acetyltransferase I